MKIKHNIVNNDFFFISRLCIKCCYITKSVMYQFTDTYFKRVVPKFITLSIFRDLKHLLQTIILPFPDKHSKCCESF